MGSPRHRSSRVLVPVLVLGLLGACEGKQSAPTSPAPATGDDAKAAPATPQPQTGAAPAGAAPAGAAPAGAEPEGPLGKILPTAPLPFDSMLGQKPADVESQLGEPLGKGMMRKSCVRHVPERTWFHCKYAMQRYADKTGTFDRITIQYEDGLAASIAWEPIPGEGPVDPVKALAAVGLEVPGKPSIHTPAENVKIWSYFNSATRLRINDREYRVEVSTVDDSWANTKVELILNDHLTEDEKSRVFTPTAKNPEAGESEEI